MMNYLTGASVNLSLRRKKKEKEKGESQWEISCLISPDKPFVCQAVECTDQAVATWSSNKVCDDTRAMCEKCQLKEMGGWPDWMKKIGKKVTSAAAKKELEEKIALEKVASEAAKKLECEQQRCQRPPREVSNRYDRGTQIQKRLLSILPEGTVTVTKIDGLNELRYVYVKEFKGQLLPSFICLINIIKQKNKWTVFDGKGTVAKEGFLPGHYELCFARVMSGFKKIPWEIFGEKRCFGLTMPEKMHQAYFPQSTGCALPMGTIKGSSLKEIDECLYSCIVDSIRDAGFVLCEAVLLDSGFKPIMYDSSLIQGGSDKGRHHDAPGGGKIVLSWGQQLR
mmetsp:Transcript_31806/g.36517  ORF Transcript_31806/g.36517 Transcript_31806/m.36517 type:complete len:338 (-) Transcript_31806:2127-3140(-)